MAFVLLVVGVGSCKAPERRPDPFGEAVAAADAVWERRAQSGGFDEAERAYSALLGRRPTASAVLWRQARVAWSRALSEPRRAERWHEVGREVALRCVAATPAVAQALIATGDRIDRTLPLAQSAPACRVYAAAHIVRLVALRGPGAALELEDATGLLTDLGMAEEPAVLAWAQGWLRVLQGRESAEAREALLAALRASPGVTFYREQALAAFPDVDGSLPAFIPDPAWALENGADTR